MQNIEWTGCLVSTLREYGGVCGLSILIANASENYLSSSEDLHKVLRATSSVLSLQKYIKKIRCMINIF